MRRSNLNPRRHLRKAIPPSTVAAADDDTSSKPSAPEPPPTSVGEGERTVKSLRLSKALTISEGTLVSEACRRMAHRRVDAVLLTDANGLLSGIVTDKDISLRVIAEGLRPDQTNMSKIMTRNPSYVSSDTVAIEALQKMVQGKFRHLPVVENGEVTGILDITKCLYDAIQRMEKAAEKGSAIVSAVEGVESQWGGNGSAQGAFIEAFRDRMFKPSLSTIIMENSKLAIVLPSDPVYLATKKMRDNHVSSVIVVFAGKPQGILTSRDVLMRVVARNLSPELTLVEKVMTANPECATVDKTILEALHIMHSGKFLHLPVVDNDGRVIACLDVLQLTHAATSLAEGPAAVNDVASTMQRFWDSALALEPPEDECEARSELSALMASEAGETTKSTYPPLGLENSFYFKFKDKKGRMHRFSCITESLDELIAVVKERSGQGIDPDSTNILYEDDEGDKILLMTDDDLVGAVHQARQTGLKVLRLHLERFDQSSKTPNTLVAQTSRQSRFTPLGVSVLAGAALVTGVAILVYLKRTSL